MNTEMVVVWMLGQRVIGCNVILVYLDKVSFFSLLLLFHSCFVFFSMGTPDWTSLVSRKMWCICPSVFCPQEMGGYCRHLVKSQHEIEKDTVYFLNACSLSYFYQFEQSNQFRTMLKMFAILTEN